MQSKVWKHSIEGNINLCLLKMQKSKTHYSYSLCNACQLFNFPWYNLSHLSKCISGWPFSFPSLSFHLLMSNPQWYFSLWSTPTITFINGIRPINQLSCIYIFLFPNEIKIMLLLSKTFIIYLCLLWKHVSGIFAEFHSIANPIFFIIQRIKLRDS